MEFIPFSKPSISEYEINEVIDTIRSGWLTTGPKVAKFENEFSQFIGCNYSIAVNSATAGLHLALEAAGIGSGDVVIVPVFTFTATAEVVRYLGATPLFVDCNPTDYNISTSHLLTILNNYPSCFPKPKAIIPVHYGGQSCDMSSISVIAEDYGLTIIEDAAHALPTTYDGAHIGTIGHITVFSFYANKTMTTGEGGMVCTNIKEYADRMKVMRLHGIDRDVFDRFTSDIPKWKYDIVAPGYKYNLTDIAASIGIHQLRRVLDMQLERERIAKYYNSRFCDYEYVFSPYINNTSDMHSWHLYVIELNKMKDKEKARDRLVKELSEKGIGTGVHYVPLHMMKYWRETYNLQESDYPNATEVYKGIVSLPIYPGLEIHQIEYIADSVISIVDEMVKEGV